MVEDWMKLPTGELLGVEGVHQSSDSYKIAQAVGVGEPEPESEGSKWLINTYNSGSELTEYDEPADGIYEIADRAVPIYTGNVWQVFSDISAWDYDSDYITDYDGNDMTQMAKLVLYDIATQVIYLYAQNNDIEV